MRGIVPLCTKLDHVGTLTRTVGDAHLVLAAAAGLDLQCTEARFAPSTDSGAIATGDLRGLRLGVIRNFEAEETDPDMTKGFEEALSRLQQIGASVTKLELSGYDAARARRAAFVLLEVGAAQNHGDRFLKEPQCFSAEMRGFLTWGAKASALQLLKAEGVIDHAVRALARCWESVDAIVSPSTPQAAFPFSQTVPENQGGFSALANLAGCPAIGVPMGLNKRSLPQGLQIFAPAHDERRELRIALAFEREVALYLVPPPPYGPMSS